MKKIVKWLDEVAKEGPLGSLIAVLLLALFICGAVVYRNETLRSDNAIKELLSTVRDDACENRKVIKENTEAHIKASISMEKVANRLENLERRRASASSSKFAVTTEEN